MAAGVLTRRSLLISPRAPASRGATRTGRSELPSFPRRCRTLLGSVEKGAKKAGQEFNVDILWNGPAAETEFARQIQIVDSMVAQRIDAIAVAPAERKALVAPIDRAAGRRHSRYCVRLES